LSINYTQNSQAAPPLRRSSSRDRDRERTRLWSRWPSS